MNIKKGKEKIALRQNRPGNNGKAGPLEGHPEEMGASPRAALRHCPEKMY